MDVEQTPSVPATSSITVSGGTAGMKREFRRPTEAFVTFCDVLHLSDELIDKAWESYDRVSTQCLLEGDEKPWIACAIYVSIWRSVSTIQLADDDPNASIAITTLLKLSGLSVLELFEKLTKWTEMVNAPRRVQEHVNRVQGNFAVSAVVFKKFLPIFRRVFRPSVEPKLKSQTPISLASLFELCWMLYVSSKKHFTGVGDDLLNCFHLLLCCVDTVHKNLLSIGRTEFLTPEYVEVDPSLVLSRLCEEFEGVMLDAKHFRVHWWIPKLKLWMTDGYSLIGNPEEQTGLIEELEGNLTRLHASYETAMLKRGEMDERILIPDDVTSIFDANQEDPLLNLRRSPEKKLRAIDTDLMLRMSVQACLEKISQQRQPSTPLSGKSYIISGDQFIPESPVSAVGHSVAKLALLIDADVDDTQSSSQPTASRRLEQLFDCCSTDPRRLIYTHIDKLSDLLERKMKAEPSDKDASFSEFCEQRISQAKRLYFRLLENVALPEKERAVQLGTDFSAPLLKEVFHSTIFACATELVLFSYGSERVFPWILDALHLPAFHFYKVIEIVIRSEAKLSREMVKHLNMIEERVLEELAWKSDSPLWDAVEIESAPSCREVALPSDLDQSGVPKMLTDDERGSGRFVSPVKGAVAAKRKLDFNGDKNLHTPKVALGGGRPGVQPIRLPGVSDGDSGEKNTPSPPTTTVVTSTNDPPATSSSTSVTVPTTRKYSSSLALFFRKVYYLSSVRLLDLCERLRVDERAKQTVWTLFEWLLRDSEASALMKDRHLDQNLMCAIYVVGKILKEDGCSFHDIMYHYRHQPQAHSKIYRHVLMDWHRDKNRTANTMDTSETSTIPPKLRSQSTLPIPATDSSPPTPEPPTREVEYSDLIRYYNRVFILQVEDFVKRLATTVTTAGDAATTSSTHTDSKENLLTTTSTVSLVALSPLPSVRSAALSPRKCVSDGVFVQPMHPRSNAATTTQQPHPSATTGNNNPHPPLSPSRAMRYNFNRSPYKDLKAINSMIRQGERTSVPTIGIRRHLL